MVRGTIAVLDNGNASYERVVWTEKGDGLSVLKETDDRALRDKRYAVVGFSGFGVGAPTKVVYDPAGDKNFPDGMTISPNRNPQWTEDMQALTFGIHTPRKRDNTAESADAEASRDGDDAPRPPRRQMSLARTRTQSRPRVVTLATDGCSHNRKCRRLNDRVVQLSRRVSSAAEDVHQACQRGSPPRSASRRNSVLLLSRTTASTAPRQPRQPPLSGYLCHRHGDRSALAWHSSARAGTTDRRQTASLSFITRTATITSMRWTRARRGTSRSNALHQFCRHRRRPQRGQAPSGFDWLDPGQRFGTSHR